MSLKGELESYRSLAENEAYNWPLSAFVPNVLAHFDLPDCYAELKRSKRLQRSGEPAASDGRARASAT